MKTNKEFKRTVLVLCFFLSGYRLNAQSFEAQQLLLNWEKLSQLKNILTDMKKGYEIVSRGYNSVKDIASGNFSLHETFLDGMMLVNPEIKKYRRVADIISYQKNIISEYKSAFKRFENSDTFSQRDLEYLGKVYGELSKQSLRNLDDLITVITSTKLRMSDDERLKAIDRIFADTEDKLQFLRSFNKETRILSLQRQKEKAALNSLSRYYP